MPSDARTIEPAAAAERAGVRLRAAEPEDAAAIARTMQDPRVVHGTLQTPYTSVAQYRERLRFTGDEVRFIVAEDATAGDGIVGNLGLHRTTRPRRLHTASLGMSVIGAWQGRGVGTALLAAALDVADNWWQVRRVHLEVYVDNEPAIALYRRFGFEVEGTLRGDAFRAGEYVDTHVMGRLHPTLAAR